MMRMLLLLLTVFACGIAAEDPYALWQNDRAAEALPLLRAEATRSDDWQAWYDAGLCAAAVEQRGLAVGHLLAAHVRAPWRPEPQQALLSLGVTPPAGWLTWLGPLAWPGTGWLAVMLAGLAGCASALALRRRRRAAWLTLAVVLILVVAPGFIATLHDQARPLAVLRDDGHLLDATGRNVQALPAGTIVLLSAEAPWQERWLVALPDGTRGYVPESDLLRP